MKKKYDFKTINIVRDYDSLASETSCIPSELEQVFLNLFKNAAQAMAEKEYAGDDGPELCLTTTAKKNKMTIRIRDNGPGIDHKVRKHVFDPFYTTKAPGVGTGLGLSVSYFIITENHGGTLEVFSKPGEWTEFVINLPVGRA